VKDFAAIDFETANFQRTSVCSVGVVIYRNGQKVDEFYSLIKPEPEYYNLDVVAALCGYQLSQHHHALADAEACAAIAAAIL